MHGPVLYAPWRMDYIRSIEKPAGDRCFLCDAAAARTDAERRERLVLWTTPHSVVCLNRYPYTNGHLLVAPAAHVPEPDVLGDEALCDLQRQAMRCVRLLRRAVAAQGFNLGTNVGRAAGAGVPGHVHQHVVPRWGGDVNFMAVVGETRVVPQAMSQLYLELARGVEAGWAGSGNDQ